MDGPRHTTLRTRLGDLTVSADEEALTGLYFPGHWHLPSAERLGDPIEADADPLLVRARGRTAVRHLEVGDLRLDLATLEVHRAGELLHLFPASRKLLQVLMMASPAAVSRRELEYALWGDEPPDGDMLRSHIYELRRSVDGNQPVKIIHTLPRIGYRVAVVDDAYAS